MSEECDIITGQCSCQEGAIGFKCDDCAFGFFGNYHTPNSTYSRISCRHSALRGESTESWFGMGESVSLLCS